MEYLEQIGVSDAGIETINRSDGTIYTFDHETVTDEYGSVQYICKGYLITPVELEGIYNGILPVGFSWNELLHRMFRTHQHQRADNEYVYAQRMFRTTGDDRWSLYITALDQWNARVSELASTFSTDVPPMPAKP